MMGKNVGYYVGYIVGIYPGWVDVKNASSGANATIFFRKDIKEFLRSFLETMRAKNQPVSFFLKKEKEDGFYMYIRHQLPGYDGRVSRTMRLRAEADQRELLREISNPVNGKGRNKAQGYGRRDGGTDLSTTSSGIPGLLGALVSEKPRGVEKIKPAKRTRYEHTKELESMP